jgi:hypothetical protein
MRKLAFENAFVAAGAALIAIVIIVVAPLISADTGGSGPSFGPIFFLTGVFLIVASPLMGFVSVRGGNLYGAVMWWMLGLPLGVGLLLVRMA